jgi:integrase
LDAHHRSPAGHSCKGKLRFQPLVQLLRISEVLGLQWKHIDFNAGASLVRQRWYRGDLDVVKSQKAVRDVPMGLLAKDLAAMFPGGVQRPDARRTGAETIAISISTS